MVYTLKLRQRPMRVVASTIILTGCLFLSFTVLSHFIINTLSDDDVVVRRTTLTTAAAYFPHSSRLQSRLAKVELAESMGEDNALSKAETAALSAVRLSPWRSDNHLLLAAVRNLQGDLEATEASMRAALKLSPNFPQAHWQLANLLVRQDKRDEAIKEFQLAVSLDPAATLLPGALEVVWNLSDADVEKLIQVAGNEPKNRLILAQYLLKQARPAEAVTVCKSIERSAFLALSASADFINALIAAKHIELAKDLWEYAQAAEKQAGERVLYNGGFEQELRPGWTQFDWQIAHSEYAILSLDTATAHSGKRSLRLNLTGRDTTVLGKELRQTFLVKPSKRYRLECYVKTDKLLTTEGLHLIIADVSSSTPIATTNAISTGSNDWQSYTLDFIAPPNTSTPLIPMLVTIKRTPRFSYDAPSKGTVWFDDFTLREEGQGK
jgi:Flp pilus assembly protein TadD